MPDTNEQAQQTTAVPQQTTTTNTDSNNNDTTSRIDYYSSPNYDTDGNATLINSNMYNVIYSNSELLFTSVTTKSGDVFYILVDYSDNDGQDNVYFLNKVDNYDLYSLLPSDDSSYVTFDEYKEINKVADRTTTTQEEDYYSTSSLADTGQTASVASSVVPNNSMLILIAVAVVAVGAAGYFAFKSGIFSKLFKKNQNAQTEDDEYYDEYDDTDESDDDE